MSIKGQSFTSAFSGGAHIDFGVGTAGLANVFASGYTIAVLAKATNSNFGLLGAFADTSATSIVREFFLNNNNGGGRLFGDGDFSGGFPDQAADADGLNDNTWRWHVMSKPTGAAHFRFHYADLATLTWVHGESVGAGNHSDPGTAVQMFTTWSVYPLGFDAGDFAAICLWPSALSDSNIVTSCTRLAADLYNVVTPKGGWVFPQATAGSTITDFTGGGANESARAFIATSADPPDFNYSFAHTIIGSAAAAFGALTASAFAGSTGALPRIPSASGPTLTSSVTGHGRIVSQTPGGVL